MCVADEIAGAAELVMGKSSAVPVVIVRGANRAWFREASVRERLRHSYVEDLFR